MRVKEWGLGGRRWQLANDRRSRSLFPRIPVLCSLRLAWLQARLDYPRDRVEVIVDDGGKTQLSAFDIPSEGFTLKRLVQADAGPAAARNKGVAHADGQFVAFENIKEGAVS